MARSQVIFIGQTPAKKQPHLPSKDELLAFIGKQPGKVGTREIARAFDLKNDRRVELKRMLRELADEGQVEARRKKLHHPGALPSVTLADITGRDADGELIATPTEWDEEAHGAAAENPHRRRARKPQPGRDRRRRRPRAAARRGDRRRRRPLQRPRHQDHRPRQGARARHLPRAAGRRRTAGAGRQEAARQGAQRSRAAPRKDAQDGDLIAVSVAAPGPVRAADGARRGDGSARSRASARSA